MDDQVSPAWVTYTGKLPVGYSDAECKGPGLLESGDGTPADPPPCAPARRPIRPAPTATPTTTAAAATVTAQRFATAPLAEPASPPRRSRTRPTVSSPTALPAPARIGRSPQPPLR